MTNTHAFSPLARLRDQLERHTWRLLAPLIAVGFAMPILGHALPVPMTIGPYFYIVPHYLWAFVAVLGLLIWRPKRPLPWLLIVGGVLTQTIAASLLSYPLITTGTVPPSPYLGDLFYLLDYPLWTAGLIILLARHEALRLAIFDIAMLGLGLAMAAGTLIAGPYFLKRHFGSYEATQALYVAMDVPLVAVALRVLLSPARRNAATLLAVLGVLAYVGSDLVWNWLLLAGITLGANEWYDTGWLMSLPLFAAAALHPRMRAAATSIPEATGRLQPWKAVLVGAAPMVGPLLLGLQQYVSGFQVDDHMGLTAVVLVASAAMAALVIGRFWILFRELGAALAERQQLLDASRTRYRELIEQLPAVVFITRELREDASEDDAGLAYMSPQCEWMLGVSREEALADGNALLAAVHADDRHLVLDAIEAVRGGQRAAVFETRFAHSDGGEVWVRHILRRITDGEGRAYIQGLLFDITDERRAEEERDRLEVELRLSQKLEAVGQLAAGVAHEINTPIQFVGNTVSFLDGVFGDVLGLVAEYRSLAGACRDGEPADAVLERIEAAEDVADIEYLSERIPEATERARDGLDRVARIVGAMRAFALPPTTGAALADINEALTNTLTISGGDYSAVADVETRFGDVPAVACNIGDLNQVFLGLIVNAAHAIHDAVDGGGERGKITVTTERDGEDVVITVSDTGCGIPEDVAGRVFDPFFTTKEVGRGGGQGLAVARSVVVDGHGGAIDFDSEPGRGTTFRVRLPIAGVAALEHAQAA